MIQLAKWITSIPIEINEANSEAVLAPEEPSSGSSQQIAGQPQAEEIHEESSSTARLLVPGSP